MLASAWRPNTPRFASFMLAALLVLAIPAELSAQTPSSCKTSGLSGYSVNISYNPVTNRTTYDIEIINLTPQSGVYVNIGEVYLYGLPTPFSTASPTGWVFRQLGGKTFWETTSNPWWQSPPAIKPFGDLEGFQYVILGPPVAITAVVNHVQQVSNPSGRLLAGTSWFDCASQTGDECIAVTKSANPTSGPAGTVVTYTITVSNCGQDVMTGMVVDDTLLGDITPQFIAANGGSDTLPVGASVTFSVNRAILTTDPQMLTNSATACGTALDEDETCGAGSASVTVEKPCIRIEKVVDPIQASVGDSVDYTYTVSNCGNVPVLNVAITDTVLGNLTPQFLAQNGGSSTLAVGGSVTFLTSRAILITDPNPLVNVVTVTGQDSHATPVSDQAQAQVDILPDPPPAQVSIAGTAYNNADCSGIEQQSDPPLAGATFRLTYPDGTFPVIDANSNPVADQTGSSFNFTQLLPGTYRVVMTPPTGFVSTNAIPGLCGGTKIANNILEVPATPGGTSCADNDFLACQPNFCIHMDKTATPAEGVVGTPITYEYRIDNCGNVPVAGVTVTDTLLGDLTPFFLVANGGSSTLAVGSAVTFTRVRSILVTDPVELVNTATACGISRDTLACGSDSATVTVLKPCIDIAKTAEPPQVQVGQNVQYAFTVTNCGDVPIDNVTVTDTVLGSLTAAFVLANGGSSTLAVGASVPFTANRIVLITDPNPLVNVVTVSGQDPNTNPVTNQTQAEVEIIPDPPPTQVSIAGGAFNDLDCSGVRDPADPPLNAIYRLTYTDGTFPVIDANTNPVADQSGPNYNFEALVPGTYRVVETNPSGYNSINALPGSCGGTAITNDILEVPATVAGTACINNDFLDCQSRPCIHIAKSVNPTEAPVGAIVTYGYHVQNCGNVLLTNITVVDSVLGDITTFFVAAHGTDTLAPSDVVDFSVNRAVTSDQPNPIRNSVTVTGTDPFETVVSSTDNGETTIPITISGTAYNDFGCTGVFDPIDTPIPNTVFALTDTQGKSVLDIFGNVVAPFTGSSYSFQNLPPGIYVVTKQDQPGFVSTNALPGFNAVKLNDDQIQVNGVVHTNYPNNDFLDCIPGPCIGVSCRVDPAVIQRGDSAVVNMEVCNCGSCELSNVKVVGTVIGDVTDHFIAANGGKDTLALGQCVKFSVAHVFTVKIASKPVLTGPGEVVTITVVASGSCGPGEDASGEGEGSVVVQPEPGENRRRCFIPVTFTTEGWSTFCDPNNPIVNGGMVYNRFPRAFAHWLFYGKAITNQLLVGYSNTITFDGTNAGLKRLCMFLSSVGGCGALKRNYVNPWGTTEAGLLATETVALMMNIAYNDERLMPRTAGYDLELFVLAKGILKGKTVGKVLDIANHVLSGAPVCAYGLDSCSELVSVLESINANYEFVDFDTYIDRGYLVPNRAFGEPDPPHAPVVP